MGMRHVLLLALASCLLAACNRMAGDAPVPSGANASLAGAASTGMQAPLPKNAFVLPGAIKADTGLTDLRRIFGVANVRESDVPGGGDDTVRGVILFPGDPKRRAYVYFRDAKAMTGLSSVSVLDQGSLWRTAQGVRIDMPLSELVVLNGQPFEFFGFEGTYGGWIGDWLGGRLASIGGGMSLHVRLSHRVFPKDVSYHDLPYENFRTFRSDQPQLARMQVIVDEITLNMPGKDDR
jgi:hypothetical protein